LEDLATFIFIVESHSSILKIEAVDSFETLIPIYKTTQRDTPEGSHRCMRAYYLTYIGLYTDMFAGLLLLLFVIIIGVGLTSPGTAATSGLLYSPR
jgi:hypothetical protein